MRAHPLLLVGGAVLWGTALWLAPPRAEALGELGAAAVRPAVLPFLWRAVAEAQQHGSAGEAFAAARAVLAFLPQWSDGHLAFAYRFTLDGDQVAGRDPAAAAADAALRLQAALALLAEGRARKPGAAIDLLIGTAFLVELAGRRHPDLGAHLAPGRPIVPAEYADSFLAEAERLGAGASATELRVFGVPAVLAGLLRAGERDRAVTVLDAALARVPEVRDRELAAGWARSLQRLRLRLLGDRDIPLAELAADPRLEALIPLLR